MYVAVDDGGDDGAVLPLVARSLLCLVRLWSRVALACRRCCLLRLLLPHAYAVSPPIEPFSAHLQPSRPLHHPIPCVIFSSRLAPSTPRPSAPSSQTDLVFLARNTLVLKRRFFFLRPLCVCATRPPPCDRCDWQANSEILDNPEPVTRLILCSGQVYYDLVAEREKVRLV